jgi:hypothetical protein
MDDIRERTVDKRRQQGRERRRCKISLCRMKFIAGA